MQMFTDFNYQKKKKRGIRIATWIRDRLVGARGGSLMEGGQNRSERWKETECKTERRPDARERNANAPQVCNEKSPY